MKQLAVVALMLAAACERPSQLDSVPSKAGLGGEGDGDNAEVMTMLRSIESRVTALENANKVTAGAANDPVTERMRKIEASLARREDALAFLDMAYAQQKRQQEAEEAKEPDPNAVFAVDIGKAVANGQVEGPNSAIVTVVEAWDFA